MNAVLFFFRDLDLVFSYFEIQDMQPPFQILWSTLNKKGAFVFFQPLSKVCLP